MAALRAVRGAARAVQLSCIEDVAAWLRSGHFAGLLTGLSPLSCLELSWYGGHVAALRAFRGAADGAVAPSC